MPRPLLALKPSPYLCTRPCGYGALHQRGVKNGTHRLPVLQNNRISQGNQSVRQNLSLRQTGCVDKHEFSIYIYIHLLTLYKLTPIGHIVYNFYHFLNKNTDGPVNN